jgi:hypothetical protein
MSEYDELKSKLTATPYVVADVLKKTVRLVDEPTAFKLLTEKADFPTHAIVNLRGALEGFAKLKGVGKSDREFRLKDVAQIAGMSYHNFYITYFQGGIVTPSIRDFGGSGQGETCEAVFSWRDAFTAGVVGTLRRQGLPIDVLRKVPALFEEKKRPKRKRRTSARA